MGERTEALIRIFVGIVSGLILGIWKMLVQFLGVIHFIVVIISGNRQQGIAEFSEIWNSQLYVYLRYMTFVSNKRPFPFGELQPNISKFKK